ncbi:MAG: hypothetical protein ACLPXT_01445, partial [Terracidiphilus sp.]
YEKASQVPQRAMLRLALPGLTRTAPELRAVPQGRKTVPIRTRQDKDALFSRNDLHFPENFGD